MPIAVNSGSVMNCPVEGVRDVFCDCYGDGVVDDGGGDPAGDGGDASQPEPENREVQGDLTSENLTVGASSATYYLVSWTT